jgi:hypothetical protein
MWPNSNIFERQQQIKIAPQKNKNQTKFVKCFLPHTINRLSSCWPYTEVKFKTYELPGQKVNVKVKVKVKVTQSHYRPVQALTVLGG